MKKKILYIFASIFMLLIIILIVASFFMLRYSIEFDHRGKDETSSYQYMIGKYPFLEQWADSIQHIAALKDTFITNDEGKKLHAYYLPASQPTSKTAVIVHGYTDNAIRMMMIGYMYNHDLNYNILLPDLQNHGQSEGKVIQMGWKDRLDVIQWMETAHRIYGDSTRMVVHGISMGAATTMMISGEDQPDYVKCFVEDCGYTSVWDEFSQELKNRFNLPEFPLLYTSSWLCKLKNGWGFQEASALSQVSKSNLPMLFIHGEADTFVPTWMVYPLYDAKPFPKELWIVPEAEHALSYADNTQEYTTRVKKFVDKYIP